MSVLLKQVGMGNKNIKFLSDVSNLEITRRHLPHWTVNNAAYFVTFRITRGYLSKGEQILVLNLIKDGDKKYYELSAVVVMPDHVHLILTPRGNYSLSRIMKGIKGISARELNKMRNRNGSIWQGESFDRILRNEKELFEKLNYMLNNPMKAGLTDDPLNYHGWFLNN